MLLEVLVLLTGDERVGELDADVLFAVRVGRLHRHVVDGVGRRRAQARRVVELPRRVVELLTERRAAREQHQIVRRVAGRRADRPVGGERVRRRVRRLVYARGR